MSIDSIPPTTVVGISQPLQQLAALSVNTTTPAPLTDLPLQAAPPALDSSPLVRALNQTLLQFGLTTDLPGAADASGTTAPATAFAGSAEQAAQNFLGALYQVASLSRAAAALNEEIEIAQHAAPAATTAGTATATAKAAVAAKAAAVQTSYTGTAFDLRALVQQIPGNATSIGVANASNTDSQASANNAMTTLQTNFETLLNTASAVNSQAVAVANSAYPSLQKFLETLVQKIPEQVTPVSPISPVANVVETMG